MSIVLSTNELQNKKVFENHVISTIVEKNFAYNER